jgi:hypothetical protein
VAPSRHAITQHPSALVGPTCNDQWNVVSSQNAGTNGNNELGSVSAISASDAWAVGDFDTGTAPTIVRQPQAQHWNGAAWTLTAQPAVFGTGDNVLLSVTAITTSNVWAVGFSKANNTMGTLNQVLIEHFDGTSWTAIADTTANNPAGTSNSLFGVKFFSATDVWAVGEAKTSSTVATAIIEHYDGTAWTTQTPAAAAAFSLLADVVPLAANDVWAAGLQQAAAGVVETLVEHFDGTTWTTVAAQNPNANGQFFNDIAGVHNDLWAVGGQVTDSTTEKTLVEHYDGAAWTVVASPTPDLSASLIGVRYAAHNDVWAEGGSAYASPGTVNELDHSLIEHFDGNAWKQVPSPNPSNHQGLFDMAMAGSNLLLTVGFSQDALGGAAGQTLSAALCEPMPAVTALNPDHGNSAGGTAVTISGSGLAFPRAVVFGGFAATSFMATSDTQITAVAPPQAVGTVVNVTVSTMGGTSATGAGSQYTYFGPGAWENAGGVLASGPAASTWHGATPEADAFVSGTDGVLYHRSYSGSTVAWEALPGPFTPASDASSVSTGVGVIDVFVRGSDGALWHRHFTTTPTPTWSTWEKLGGMITGAPAAVSVGSGGIVVFVQGADNHLWYGGLAGTTAWTWQPTAGGVLTAPPAAVSAAANTADAFVKGGDNALWQYSITATTTTWTSRGGRLASKPAVISRATNGIDAFVEGTDTALWHWNNGSGGSLWESVGGKLAAAPAAVSWGSARQDVFVEGTDSALYHAWSTSLGFGSPPWRWEGVGGRLMGSPAAVAWGVNRLDVFARGADNHLWHVPFN